MPAVDTPAGVDTAFVPVERLAMQKSKPGWAHPPVGPVVAEEELGRSAPGLRTADRS